MLKYYAFVIILGILVTGLLFLGISTVGNPFNQRLIKLDTQRLSDFASISYKIEDYYQQNDLLPVNTNTMNNMPTDPESKKSYEYKIVSTNNYRLCTIFSTDSKLEPTVGYNSGKKEHKKGYDCIDYFIPNSMIRNITPVQNMDYYDLSPVN